MVVTFIGVDDGGDNTDCGGGDAYSHRGCSNGVKAGGGGNSRNRKRMGILSTCNRRNVAVVVEA